jgi:hypothetical protein
VRHTPARAESDTFGKVDIVAAERSAGAAVLRPVGQTAETDRRLAVQRAIAAGAVI